MKACVITGEVSPKTGGPLATFRNAADVTRSLGFSTTAIAVGSKDEPPGWLTADSTIHHNYLSSVGSIAAAFRTSELIIVMGVWHINFAICMIFATFFRRPKLVLIPTNSLMPWDWSKHAATKRLLRPLMFMAARRIDYFLCASSGELDQSWPKNFRNSQVIPHAVRIDQKTTRTHAGPIRRIIFVGRIVDQKDMPLFLRTAALVKPRLDVEVCGSGDQASLMSAQALAAELGLDVRWRNWLDKQTLHETMAKDSVLLVTSKAENFCHAAAEAASLGTPVVIVDRVASAADLGRSPIIMAAPAEPNLLAESVQQLIDNFAHENIEHAVAWARAEWSPEAFRSRWKTMLIDLGLSMDADKS